MRIEGGELVAANNLSDLRDAAAARANLGVASVSADALGVVGAGSLHTQLNAALAACAANGVGDLVLGPKSYNLSGGRVFNPAGVTLRGTPALSNGGAGTVLIGGAYAIINQGTIRDVTIAASTFTENPNAVNGGGVAIYGGRIEDVAVRDGVTMLFPTRNLHGRLPNTMARLKTAKIQSRFSVGLFGDSLVEGGGSGNIFSDLLFNPAYAATTGANYNMANFFGYPMLVTDVDMRAVGGSTAYQMVPYIGYERTLNAAGSGGGYNRQMFQGEIIGTPPLPLYDLVIIGVGQNGGTYWPVYLEQMVKHFRDLGTDVIILTQNPARTTPSHRASDVSIYRNIADAYGACLVDTYTRFRVAYETGALALNDDTFPAGDSIHPNQTGWNIYAQAILDAMLDHQPAQCAAPATTRPQRRAHVVNQNLHSSTYDLLSGVEWQSATSTDNKSAGCSFVTPLSTTRSPNYGRRSLTNSCLQIPQNEYAHFGIEHCAEYVIVYEQTAIAATGEVSIQGGSFVLGTFTTGTTNGRVGTAVIAISGGAMDNRTIRVRCTSAEPLKILGVAALVRPRVNLRRNASTGVYPDITLAGTWATHASYYPGVTNILYTDTVGSTATFDFYGDGLHLLTYEGQLGGQFTVQIDGVLAPAYLGNVTTVDTYSGVAAPGAVAHTFGGLQMGRHRCVITMTGANASAGTPNAGSTHHRLGLIEVAALRSGWARTEIEAYAPHPATTG